MVSDKVILSEFKKAIRNNAESELIDLDRKFSVKFDFQAQRLEDVLEGTNLTIPPIRWSYHRISLLTEGSANYSAGMKKFKATKNTLTVIPARMVTSSNHWSTNTRGYVLLFNLEFFLQNNFPHRSIGEKTILQATAQPHVKLTDEQIKPIIEIFETILREKNSNDKHASELIALKVAELLIICERLFKGKVETSNLPSVEIVKRFMDLVEANYLSERSVSFYASQLNVHPNYLNALIKKHTGLTAKESIQNRLLLETKYLLHSTSLSIKEISNQMGFHDPNYFTVFFKKLEKVSPVGYRASLV